MFWASLLDFLANQFVDLAAFGNDLLNDAVLCYQGGNRLIGLLPLAKYPPIMVQYFVMVLLQHYPSSACPMFDDPA